MKCFPEVDTGWLCWVTWLTLTKQPLSALEAEEQRSRGADGWSGGPSQCLPVSSRRMSGEGAGRRGSECGMGEMGTKKC